MQCMTCICNYYDSEEFWYGEEKGFFLADVCVGQGGRVALGVFYGMESCGGTERGKGKKFSGWGDTGRDVVLNVTSVIMHLKLL